MKRNLALSLAAGILGGLISHQLSTPLVHAQAQPAAPKEIRAERFVLVNERGAVLGTLTEEAGRPSLKLFAADGREIWSAGGKIGVHSSVTGR
jgi:hypothetical protein